MNRRESIKKLSRFASRPPSDHFWNFDYSERKPFAAAVSDGTEFIRLVDGRAEVYRRHGGKTKMLCAFVPTSAQESLILSGEGIVKNIKHSQIIQPE